MRKRGRPSESNGMAEMPSINLRVKSQDWEDVCFKIRPDTKFSRLFNIYCERRKLEHRTIQFFYDGQRILGSHTPAKLNLEDHDEIEAMTHALGGGCSGF